MSFHQVEQIIHGEFHRFSLSTVDFGDSSRKKAWGNTPPVILIRWKTRFPGGGTKKDDKECGASRVHLSCLLLRMDVANADCRGGMSKRSRATKSLVDDAPWVSPSGFRQSRWTPRLAHESTAAPIFESVNPLEPSPQDPTHTSLFALRVWSSPPAMDGHSTGGRADASKGPNSGHHRRVSVPLQAGQYP